MWQLKLGCQFIRDTSLTQLPFKKVVIFFFYYFQNHLIVLPKLCVHFGEHCRLTSKRFQFQTLAKTSLYEISMFPLCLRGVSPYASYYSPKTAQQNKVLYDGIV